MLCVKHFFQRTPINFVWCVLLFIQITAIFAVENTATPKTIVARKPMHDTPNSGSVAHANSKFPSNDSDIGESNDDYYNSLTVREGVTNKTVIRNESSLRANLHNSSFNFIIRRQKLEDNSSEMENSTKSENVPELVGEWECGTDELSKYISESTIDRDCPLLKNDVNRCCIAHDACYDNQLGQKRCDDVFCNCLEAATRAIEVCHQEDGPLFCNLVREFGADPYRQAGIAARNNNESEPLCGVVEGFYGRPWTTEQRRHLFKNIRKLGMDTYLYAPKDDIKHRAEWRILYTAEETALLESLIVAAKESKVTFVYALSPGIDIVYSNPKEVKAVRDKLAQVRSMGCTAFALLFDDIEPSMNSQDRKQFPSFAAAQVYVSNDVYEHLGYPLFMFCPTEYCESRAVPTIEDSEYLNTLGTKLHTDIMIMWTGPRVVSRYLTVEHIRRLSRVLRRKPLIWDNLHANDYDPKRVFMGPFAGRPVGLKNEISGLLLNPNSKYEANFIPFFTLADWNRSQTDAPKVENDQNAKLESNVQDVADQVVEQGKPALLYHPLTSLKKALENWMLHYTQGPGPNVPPISQMETQAIATVIDPSAGCSSVAVPPPSIRTCEGNELLPNVDAPHPVYTSPIGTATTVTVQAFPISEAIIGVTDVHENVIGPQTVNSLSVDYNEPMETLSTVSKDENQASTAMEIMTENSDFSMDECGNSDSSHENVISPIESLKTLVDIFYLPFEHGQRGVQFLQEFQWLHENAHIVRLESDKPDKKESAEWLRRFDAFKTQLHQLNCLYRLIIESPNKSLVQEIFPYVWEAQGILSVLGAILAWMREGNLLIAPPESGSWWDNAACDDLEPWALGGGLLPDLQKLVVTSPQLADFFTIKFAIPLSLTCYTIRPICSHQDLNKQMLYECFSTTEEREQICAIVGSENHPEEMFFDRIFSPLLKYGSLPHNFIAEEFNNFSKSEMDTENNRNSFFVIALGILNLEDILEQIRNEFVPEYKAKYSKIIKADDSISDHAKEERRRLLNADIETWGILRVPKHLLQKYSSFVEVRWRNYSTEAVAVRRILHCISATFALNGSTGFMTLVDASNSEKSDLLTRVGLTNILADPQLSCGCANPNCVCASTAANSNAVNASHSSEVNAHIEADDGGCDCCAGEARSLAGLSALGHSL